MRTRTWFRLLALASAAAGLFLTCTPPILARQEPASNPPTGTGKISGLVITADDGLPVRRARVLMMGGVPQARAALSSAGAAAPSAPSAGTPASPAVSVTITSTSAPVAQGLAIASSSSLPPGMFQKEAESDASGRFEFSGLPDGRYSLTLQPPEGYVRPRDSQAVQLKDAKPESVTFRLVRTGAITGRVLDEAGDPLARAFVRAIRLEVSATIGRYPLGSMTSASTDDRGVYRLFNLQPGEYQVVAEYMNVPPRSEAVEGPKTGFVATFFPSAVAANEGSVVAVRSGQDTASIDISLQHALLGRVIGQAIDKDGNPLVSPNGELRLSPRGSIGGIGQSISGSGSRLSADGQFAFTSVPPGDYYLVAMVSRSMTTGLAREAGYVPVTVRGEEVSANIQTNVGATVSGRVVLEGPPLSAAAATALAVMPAPQMRVMNAPVGSGEAVPWGAASPGQSAPVKEDGSFEITGLRGPLRLMVSGSRGVASAVRFSGRDITDVSIDLVGTERIEDLELVMTTATGELTGRVRSAGGSPAGGARIIVFPEQPARWFSGSPFVRNTRSLAVAPPPPPASARTVGRVVILPAVGDLLPMRVAPGRYYVIALDSGSDIVMPDRALLGKLRPYATLAEVVAGQRTAVELRVVK